MNENLTNQPTALPRGYLWFWCDKCDGNPQCGRCGGGNVFNLTWSMPIYNAKYNAKYSVINSRIC